MRTVTYDETKYRLVPLAPTREMLAAAQRAWINDPARKTSTLWRAMLAAAHDHPATAGDAEDAARYRMARKLPLVLAYDRVAPHRPEKFDAMIDRELRASKGTT